ncbi:MAG: hydantoinase/oxoprolinase family protein [Desulfovibrio sp.]|nr:hydantoinase/oxoprolinase family protein [Desulfovibrio sp.]
MAKRVLLGIDAGGTHTDAVLVSEEESFRVCAQAKEATRHDDLPTSITHVLTKLQAQAQAPDLLTKVTHVTLGTTLAVNALVQGKVAPVGLLLAAGPGLAPERFALGDYAVVPGGLDHRGTEVAPLDCDDLAPTLAAWKAKGISHVCCVSKFSPRNPKHEQAMAKLCEAMGFTVTMGHSLSGQLNFPRRIATAWYNAAVHKLHASFADAVCATLDAFSIHAQVRFLKADGGAILLDRSREEPVQSILSGPAASVMGAMALRDLSKGTTILFDIGGTTTDMAVLVDGSPVLDRMGMLINNRRTLVRALAQSSIGVGGDSLIACTEEGITTGPLRLGNAMAFGGEHPTLLDALNVADATQDPSRGDCSRSLHGITRLATKAGLSPEDLANQAIAHALTSIKNAWNTLAEHINAHPIYTLKALRACQYLKPDAILLVGGPAQCLAKRLEDTMHLPVLVPEASDVANAIGCALTQATDILEIYADSGKRLLKAPRLDYSEPLDRKASLEHVRNRAIALLTDHLASQGLDDVRVEVLEEDIFAVLDDYGSSSRDIRVTCQAVPGILGRVNNAHCAL